MQYAFLEQMLINSIKEVQIKLGYEKEAIRFYYPEKALIRLRKKLESDSFSKSNKKKKSK